MLLQEISPDSILKHKYNTDDMYVIWEVEVWTVSFAASTSNSLRLLNNATLRNHYSGQNCCLHALTVIVVTLYSCC